MRALSLNEVSTTTRASGASDEIRRVAATPSTFGIARAMSTTSGCSAIAAATPSAPSAAVPTTSMPSVLSSRRARPSRTTAWAAQSSTRILPSWVIAGSYYPSLIAESTSCQRTLLASGRPNERPPHGSTAGPAHERHSRRHGGQPHADAGPPVALYDATQPSHPLGAVAPGEIPVVPPRPHLLAPRPGGAGAGR